MNITHSIAEITHLLESGNFPLASQQVETLLHSYPQHSELWRLLGLSKFQLGQLEAAQKAIQHALELAPHSIEAWCNLASVAMAQNCPIDAEQALRQAIKLDPTHATVWNNLGGVIDARGDHVEAAKCFAKATQLQADYVPAWLNLAGVLLELHEVDKANETVDNALKLSPQNSNAYFVQGNILLAAGKKREALIAYQYSARLQPRNPHLHHQIAQVLEDLQEWSGAIQAYEKALKYAPNFSLALSQLVFLKRRLCDWSGLDILSNQLIDVVNHQVRTIAPFSFLVEDATPAQQLSCARQFAKDKQTEVASLTKRLCLEQFKKLNDGRLRVGFFSAGFGEHPTALLIVELIEKLSTSNLYTIGFATTPNDQGNLRKRLNAAFHELHDLTVQTLEQRIRKVHACRLDILIDLDGYCGGSQPELFALKPAPIQINWLAFPGTLGAPWYDYLIADRFVIPDESAIHYSEKIVYLPHCFQPSDTTRQVGIPPSREECGLPRSGTVFVSFNNSYKFTKKTFSKWTKILHAVPNSVLWLLSGPPNSSTNDNLLYAVQTTGIAPERLIFNAKLDHSAYLTRYRHADLFLDTNPYNAHTTASDALWAGCPVLTQPGTTFAARVAGSLNYHLGLADLNVASDDAYVEKAIELACYPERLIKLHNRLAQAKQSQRLFDMTEYAKDFVKLMWEISKNFM